MSKARIEFGEIRIGPTAQKHINDCLQSNWISMGPKTKQLEEEFAQLMGAEYAVAMNSGTSCLTAMTLALPEIAKRKVVRGKSKVICPALAFIANTTGIISGGLIPKWVDIDPDTLNLQPHKVAEAVTADPDVVAIYAVGTMGLPANMPRLREIADMYDLILFEDACENYGSTIDGVPSWKYGIGGCSSMFQAHLVQAGEGGLVFTDDLNLYNLLRSIRSHGRHPDSAYFDHIRLGSNFKTTDLCSAIALEGVEQFYENIEKRKYVWNRLVNHVHEKGYDKYAWFSLKPAGVDVMPHGFSITVKPDSGKNIDDLKAVFDRENIHWKLNFGVCGGHKALMNYVPEETYYNEHGEAYSGGPGSVVRLYPNAWWCGENGIHAGTHRYMNEENIDRIINCLDRFFI